MRNTEDRPFFFECLLSILLLCGLICQGNSLFIEQPGDRQLLGVLGYPLEGIVPCILQHNDFREIEWKERCDRATFKFATNHSIIDSHNAKYEFLNRNNTWDYSLKVKNLTCTRLELGCVLWKPTGGLSPSTWSYIEVLAPPIYPECDTTLAPGDFLEEGDTTTMTCMSEADSQDASLRWYNGTNPLSTHDHQDNYTKIEVKVTKYDDGRQLVCKSENDASRLLGITPTCSVNLAVFSKNKFVKQPGDKTLVGVFGHSLNEYVPCVLEHVPLEKVHWEEKLDNISWIPVSSNHTILISHRDKYEFRDVSNQWDYSLVVKNLSSDTVQVRCCVKQPYREIIASPWANITVVVSDRIWAQGTSTSLVVYLGIGGLCLFLVLVVVMLSWFLMRRTKSHRKHTSSVAAVGTTDTTDTEVEEGVGNATGTTEDDTWRPILESSTCAMHDEAPLAYPTSGGPAMDAQAAKTEDQLVYADLQFEKKPADGSSTMIHQSEEPVIYAIVNIGETTEQCQEEEEEEEEVIYDDL